MAIAIIVPESAPVRVASMAWPAVISLTTRYHLPLWMSASGLL